MDDVLLPLSCAFAATVAAGVALARSLDYLRALTMRLGHSRDDHLSS